MPAPRPLRSSALLGGVLAGALVLRSSGLDPLGPAREPAGPVGLANPVLDEAWTEYRDRHQGGRIIARVHTVLARSEDGEAAELAIRPSAVGATVEPIAGFRGVRGANVRTAEELEGLVGEGRIELWTRPAAGAGEARAGVVRVAGRASLPERRIGAGGRIEFEARTRREHVTELELATGPLSPGAWRSEVVVGGRVRLAVTFTFDESGGAVLAVEDPEGAQ